MNGSESHKIGRHKQIKTTKKFRSSKGYQKFALKCLKFGDSWRIDHSNHFTFSTVIKIQLCSYKNVTVYLTDNSTDLAFWASLSLNNP